MSEDTKATAIRYTNHIDDLLAFQRYYFAHSPAMRRILSLTWGGALAVFAGALVVLITLDPLQMTRFKVVACAVGALIYAGYMKWTLRRNVAKLTRKLYSESPNKTVIGWHELEATASCLVERSAYNESKTAWAAVEQIASTPDHVFIYVGPGRAHVVPTNRIESGSLTAFWAELGQHFDPAKLLTGYRDAAIAN